MYVIHLNINKTILCIIYIYVYISIHMYVSTLNTFVNLLALGATALQNSTNSDLCSFLQECLRCGCGIPIYSGSMFAPESRLSTSSCWFSFDFCPHQLIKGFTTPLGSWWFVDPLTVENHK